jgi:hypothetical protein
VNEVRARDVQLLGGDRTGDGGATPAPKPPVDEEIPF